MYAIKYYRKSVNARRIANKKYDHFFADSLSEESREVRFRLLEFLASELHYTGTIKSHPNGKPIPIEILENLYFWSISHSEHYVAFSISDTPTGIDIVEMIERDGSLLSTHTDAEYYILWGKNWQNFYLLWSAKESIIKCASGVLEDVSSIWLREILPNGILMFEFSHQIYKIKSMTHKNLIISTASLW